jgi:DHA2 family multidrug resistance protein
MGPALGGWLTYEYSWRWVFYINLPVGVLCTLGVLVFMRQTRYVHREPFDFFGFLTLSLGIGALQLMLDRGELKDWFGCAARSLIQRAARRTTLLARQRPG